MSSIASFLRVGNRLSAVRPKIEGRRGRDVEIDEESSADQDADHQRPRERLQHRPAEQAAARPPR
jgi:hypothetical protein